MRWGVLPAVLPLGLNPCRPSEYSNRCVHSVFWKEWEILHILPRTLSVAGTAFPALRFAGVGKMLCAERMGAVSCTELCVYSQGFDAERGIFRVVSGWFSFWFTL